MKLKNIIFNSHYFEATDTDEFLSRIKNLLRCWAVKGNVTASAVSDLFIYNTYLYTLIRFCSFNNFRCDASSFSGFDAFHAYNMVYWRITT